MRTPRTRLPPNVTPSSPDLTLISGHLALTASWLPSISLNSDHLPILINLVEDPQDSLKSQPILHNNYRRADWASYTDFTESAFSALPPPSSSSIGEKTFRNILRDASVHFIPRGSIPNYTPHLSHAAKRLTSERDRLRATDPQNPEIAILNNHISDELDSSARSAWTERVMAATPKDNSTKFYSLLRSLSGKKAAVAPNQPIMFGNGSLSNTTSIARAFCKTVYWLLPQAHSRLPPTSHQVAPAGPLPPSLHPCPGPRTHNGLRQLHCPRPWPSEHPPP